MSRKFVFIDYLANHPNLIPLLSQWNYDMWGYLDPSNTPDKNAEQLRQSANLRQIPTCFVAIEDSQLLGSAGLIISDLSIRPELTPWLASVLVGEAYRNRGIGSALVQRVMEEAATLEVETLHLITPDKQNFYTRLGWTAIEDLDYRNELVTLMTFQPPAG